jgi:hypothetical protein
MSPVTGLRVIQDMYIRTENRVAGWLLILAIALGGTRLLFPFFIKHYLYYLQPLSSISSFLSRNRIKYEMDLCKAIAEYLIGHSTLIDNVVASSQLDVKTSYALSPSTEAHTAEFLLSELFAADKLGPVLETRLQNIVKESKLVYVNGLWYEGIAKVLLDRFESLIEEGEDVKFTGAVNEALDKARLVVKEFIQEHPMIATVFVTLLVLRLLMYAAPWAVRALGFTLDRPLKGKLVF